MLLEKVDRLLWLTLHEMDQNYKRLLPNVTEKEIIIAITTVSDQDNYRKNQYSLYLSFKPGPSLTKYENNLYGSYPIFKPVPNEMIYGYM